MKFQAKMVAERIVSTRKMFLKNNELFSLREIGLAIKFSWWQKIVLVVRFEHKKFKRVKSRIWLNIFIVVTNCVHGIQKMCTTPSNLPNTIVAQK